MGGFFDAADNDLELKDGDIDVDKAKNKLLELQKLQYDQNAFLAYLYEHRRDNDIASFRKRFYKILGAA